MKKVSLLLIIVMMFSAAVLTSCGGSDASDSKSEEEPAEEPAKEPAEEPAEKPEIDSRLVGKWYYDGNIINATFVFDADGTGTYAFGSGENPTEHKLTWETEGDKLLITYEDETGVQENQFSIDGDVLTIDTDGDVTEYKKQ